MTDHIEDDDEAAYAAYMAATCEREQDALTDQEKLAMDAMNVMCQAAEEKAEAAMIIARTMDPAVEGLRELSWAYVEYGEMTVDPDALVISPSTVNDKTVEQVAILLLHEWGHIKFDHLTRWRALRAFRAELNDPGNHPVWHIAWNIAADLEINAALLKQYGAAMLEDDGVFPGFGLYADIPADLKAEEYFQLIRATPALWASVERRAGQKLKSKADAPFSP